MRILGFGTYDTRSHPRVQVLLEGLRARGFKVAELDRPLGVSTAGRVAAMRSPKHLLSFAMKLAQRWVSLSAGSLRYRGQNRPDALLVGYMGHFDVLLARALFPGTPIILDHLVFAADTAKDRGAKGRLLGKVLGGLDRAALNAATIIVVDTPEHQQMVPEALRSRSLVVLVGAPNAWFEARREIEKVPTPSKNDPSVSVIFFGLFTPLQGAPHIAEGLRDAAQRGSLAITMVGTGQEYDQCREILQDTPVRWLEWVEAADLPDVVAAHDVCLGILGTTDKALRVVPNKVYQGMAAGCCVITSDTPAQREVLGEAVLWCPPGNAKALANQLFSLSGDRQLLNEMRTRACSLADSSFRTDEVVAPLAKALL